MRVTDIWSGGVHPAWRDIRLVDLLQHRAGAPSSVGGLFKDLITRMWKPDANDYQLRAEYAQRTARGGTGTPSR